MRTRLHRIWDFWICNEELRRNIIFQVQILLLNAKFLGLLPLVLFLLPWIYLYFSLNCGSRNVGNNDEQSGEVDMGRSRGRTAMSYLPLLKYSTSTIFLGQPNRQIYWDIFMLHTTKISERKAKYRYYKCENTPQCPSSWVIRSGCGGR